MLYLQFQLLIDALKAFLNVFSADEAPKREGPLHSATFSIKLARVTPVDLTPPPHLFGFSDGLSSNVNRLKITSPERVLEALSAICPFLVALITDEKRQYINDALEITSKLTNVSCVLIRFLFAIEELIENLNSSWFLEEDLLKMKKKNLKRFASTVIRVRRGTLPSDFESSLRKIVDPLLVLARKDNIPSKLTHHIQLLTTSTQTQH
ncbi:unnamed protein product [Anisakis simplex]|uniref:Testis-expressed sequence 10 protein (inferred by orthology to a human protein) n=1 Tax=Anisakis simplex TaxID=6269 RepID=A0A0M3J6D9_ANISI|nr:unnamed protein product [Anisakis simplex]